MSNSRIVETKNVVLLIASIVERESEQMQIFPLLFSDIIIASKMAMASAEITEEYHGCTARFSVSSSVVCRLQANYFLVSRTVCS